MMSEGCIMPPPPPPPPQELQASNNLKINPWASYTVPDSLRSLEQLMTTKRTTKVKLVILKKSHSLSMAGEKSVAAPRTRVRMTSPNTAPAPKNKEVKLIIRNEEKGTTEKINIKKCPDDDAVGNVGGWRDVMQHLKMEQSGAAVKIDIEDPEFGAVVDDSFGFPGTDATGHPINDYADDCRDDWYCDADDYDGEFPGDFPAPEVKIETEDVKDGEGEGGGNEQSESYDEEDDDDSDFGEKPSKTKKRRGRPKKSQVGKCNNTKWSRASNWTRGKWKLKTKKGEGDDMVESKPDAKMTAITLDAYVVRDVVEDPRKRNKVEVQRDKNNEDRESSAQDTSKGLAEDSFKLHNEDGNNAEASIDIDGETGNTRQLSEISMTEGGVAEPDQLSEHEPKDENCEEMEGPGEVKGEELDEGLQRTYRDRRLFACPFCPFVSCKKIWLAHIKRIHDAPERRQLLWCKITPKKCGLPFTDEDSRERHVREVHVAAHKCSICEKEFKFPYMLRDHMSNMHGTKIEKIVNLDYGTRSFVCTYCGKNFGSKSGMASHEANHHTGQFRHKCHLCGKGFFNKHNLTVHLRIHAGETPFICATCGMGFPQKARLNAHERAVHSDRPREKIPCKVCGNLVGRRHMWQHLKNHEGSTKSFCSVCGKEFPTASSRKRHEKIHFEEKEFSCKFCGKSFVQKVNMEAHERIHTGEKPYACKFCPERFIQGTRRNQHQAACKARIAF